MRYQSLEKLYPGIGEDVHLRTDGEVQGIVLHPAPNMADPNDPLRWPRWKKYACFFSVCMFPFNTGFSISGISPALYKISLEFHTDTAETTNLVLYPILTLGIFMFVWTPLANRFGKRPVLVGTSLILALCYLWGALSHTYKLLLWSNIIAAVGASAQEPLGVATVNDIFFTHEHGHATSIYYTFFAVGNTIGPLITGFIVTNTTWRWAKWVAFILSVIDWLLIIFLVPETSYDRDMFPLDHEVLDYSEGKSVTARTEELTVGDPIGQHNGPGDHVPIASYWEQLSLVSKTPRNRSSTLLGLFLRPFGLILYPAVLLACITQAITLAWALSAITLNSFVLQAPPYNMRASSNGLINIAALIGNIFGAWSSGWLVDRFCLWWSARSGTGTHRPETRLYGLFIPSIVIAAGLILFGYGVGLSLAWPAIFVAYGMISVGLTSTLTTTAVYASECYLPVNADALVLINAVKNIGSFGFTYAVVPWVEKAGYINSFGAQAGIYVALILLCVPFIIWGSGWRRLSVNWPVIITT